MSTIIGPIEGICHEFALRTFDTQDGDQSSYTLTAQVNDPATANAIRDAVSEITKAKAIHYDELQYPPVQAAEESNVEGAVDGLIVRARYRLDAKHLSPFTLDGKTSAPPEKNDALDRKMQQVGRKVKFAIRFNGTSPTAETLKRGDRVIPAKPAGAMYCDLIAVMPLKEVVPVGTAIEAVAWNTDADDVLDLDEVDGPVPF